MAEPEPTDATRCSASWPRTLGVYAVAGLLAMTALTVHMRLWQADLGIPFQYVHEADTLFNNMVIKCVLDHGWYLENPNLGAPGVMGLYDFPMTNDLNMLAIKALGMLDHNPFRVVNEFYIATFVVTAWTALLALRRCGIDDALAIGGALAYSFLPYHFFRGQIHLFLSAYHAIPLIALMTLWVAEGRPIFFEVDRRGRPARRPWGSDATLAVASCLVLGGSDIYYAYFGCVLVAVAGLIAVLRFLTWRALGNAVVLLGLTSAVVFLSIAPSLWHGWQSGFNPAPTDFGAPQADLLGMRIANLLKPAPGHWLYGFVNPGYTDPPLNENRYAYLGIPGALGFLILLLVLFVMRPLPGRLEALRPLSRLNIAAVLVGTQGGLGVVFAAMLVPQIRGYNRLSIVIGFYAILALLLVAQTLVEWVPRTAWRRGLTATLTVLLLLCGLVSQVPRTVRPEFDALARRFATDREFLKRVEAVLPTGARVFQLPVLGMPDQGQHRMSQFAHLRGYLHTHGPRWSYGAIAGREIDRWQREIAAKPVEAMVASLREARFSGLYIDRFGFPDQAQRLEGRLRDLLEREPIVSGDRRFLFFDLRDNHASGGVP